MKAKQVIIKIRKFLSIFQHVKPICFTSSRSLFVEFSPSLLWQKIINRKRGKTTNQNLLPKGSLKLGEEVDEGEEPPRLVLIFDSPLLLCLNFTNILRVAFCVRKCFAN